MMKNLLKYLALILMFAVGGALGGVVMLSLFLNGDFGSENLILLTVGIAVAFYLCVILHEAGHLIFGLIGGYRFSSFRIGSIMLVRQNGKLCLRLLKLVGTGGQCLMIPPESRMSAASCVLYNLGGVIINTVCAVIFGILYLFLPYTAVVTQILLMAAVFSLIFALLNGIPLNMGMPNDGLNTLYILKNPDAMQAMNYQLLIASANAEGIRLSDMPDLWFSIDSDSDLTDPLCGAISVFACNRLLDKRRIHEAREAITSLLNSDVKLAELHKCLLASDLIFCILTEDGNMARIANWYTDAQKKFMKAMKTNPSVIRTEYAIALIRDKDENIAENIRQKFEKVAKTYPYQQEIDSERELIELALERYNFEKQRER